MAARSARSQVPGGHIAASKDQVKFAANSSKRTPVRHIRPGFETVSWQHAAHAQ